ncbi:MAG: metallophosphoesterase [Clostridium sp.]
MSRYIMSDIHGHYKEFTEFLEKVDFNENDELYINGDLIDRGIGSSQLIDFVISNKNVYLILGNHEEMFMKAYKAVDLNSELDIREVVCTNKDGIETTCKVSENEDLSLWLSNGAYDTILEVKRFNNMSGRDLFKEFYDYLQECPRWLLIDDNIIFHAGVGFYPGRKYTNEEIEEILGKVEESKKFLWDRYLWNSAFVKDRIGIPSEYTGIIGHTPVQRTDNYIEDYIEKSTHRENDYGGKLINLDFGVYSSGIIGAYDIDNSEITVLIDDEIKKYKV